MLGLSYSVEVADDQALVVNPGQVLVPDMSNIELIGSLQGQDTSPSVLEYMANRSVNAGYHHVAPSR